MSSGVLGAAEQQKNPKSSQQAQRLEPQAIKTAADFAKSVDALKLFDAGDVQANGFQIVEDDTPFDTVTESGASYMGFAASALMAAALAGVVFFFMQNPGV